MNSPRLLEQEEVQFTVALAITTSDDAGQPIVSPDADYTVVDCNMQPLPGKEILQLPEADRRTQMLAMYSTILIPLKALVKRFPDTAEETFFEVLKEGDWIQYPSLRKAPHYRTVLGMLEAQ